MTKIITDTVLLPVDVVKDAVDESRDSKGRTRTHRRVDDLDKDLDEIVEDM